MQRRTIGTIDGVSVDEVTLTSDILSVSILSYGAITRRLRLLGASPRDLVLFHDDLAGYRDDPTYLGAIVGRVANRVAGGRFALEGESFQLVRNEGANQLHGGPEGISRQHWVTEHAESMIKQSLTLPDGHMGYPGQVRFEVVTTLRENRVTYDMRADVDRPTPINLAQHNYYNLSGARTIWDHRLTCPAGTFLPVDSEGIPTGEHASVEGTRFDYRKEQRIGANDPDHQGADINFVLPDPIGPAAKLSAGGVTLLMHTDQPGLQFYTGAGLPHPFSGLCLEPQGFPNAVNCPEFPSIIVTPERPYRQVLTLEVT